MFDRRLVFFLVFVFTFVSTVLVALISMITGQSMLTTALFSLATMWITGIVSQLLFHNLYLNMVHPLELKKMEKDFLEDREAKTRGEADGEEEDASSEVDGLLEGIKQETVASSQTQAPLEDERVTSLKTDKN